MLSNTSVFFFLTMIADFSTIAYKGVELRSKFIKSEKPGHTLVARYWKPEHPAKIKGLVFVSHGYNTHLSDIYGYRELGNILTSLGFLVFGHDHLGHGRSTGRRLYIESVDEYVDDLFLHCSMVRHQYPDLPLYVFGHSMGGLIAVTAAIRRPKYFAGLILDGPFLQVHDDQAGPVGAALVHLLSPVLPEFRLGEGVDVEDITRDFRVQQKIIDDELASKEGFKVIMLRAWLRSFDFVQENVYKVTVPMLILHGEEDQVANPEGAKMLYRDSSSKDKKLLIFPEAKHHLVIEEPYTRKAVFQEIVRWLSKRNRQKIHY